MVGGLVNVPQKYEWIIRCFIPYLALCEVVGGTGVNFWFSLELLLFCYL